MFKIPEITYPLRLDTIGKLIAVGHELIAFCETEGCEHKGRVNLVALANKFGMDHSSRRADIVPHLYCPRCRAVGRPDKNLTFKGLPCTDPHSAWPRERE